MKLVNLFQSYLTLKGLLSVLFFHWLWKVTSRCSFQCLYHFMVSFLRFQQQVSYFNFDRFYRHFSNISAERHTARYSYVDFVVYLL